MKSPLKSYCKVPYRKMRIVVIIIIVFTFIFKNIISLFQLLGHQIHQPEILPFRLVELLVLSAIHPIQLHFLLYYGSGILLGSGLVAMFLFHQ